MYGSYAPQRLAAAEVCGPHNIDLSPQPEGRCSYYIIKKWTKRCHINLKPQRTAEAYAKYKIISLINSSIN